MKSVKIAEFKNRLSAYLRQVRQGEKLIVTDRETPVATVSPAAANEPRITIDRPRRDPATLAKLRFPPLKDIDSLEILRQERGSR